MKVGSLGLHEWHKTKPSEEQRLTLDTPANHSAWEVAAASTARAKQHIHPERLPRLIDASGVVRQINVLEGPSFQLDETAVAKYAMLDRLKARRAQLTGAQHETQLDDVTNPSQPSH